MDSSYSQSSKTLRRSELSISSRSMRASRIALTPYNTPFRSRNQSLCHPDVLDAQTKRAVNKLKNLLKIRWYVFHVSPLFNLTYSEASLKRFARRMKDKLISRLSDQSTTEFEVSYTPYENLQLNNIDHKAIEISIVKISDSGKRSEAYNGILLSWGALACMQPENATYLPILICNGLKTFMKQVHAEFQQVHDCYVNPFDISEEEMRILTFGFLMNSTYEEDATIKLKYVLPRTPKSGMLDISLPTSVFSDLCRSLHGSTSKQWTDLEVTTFWSEFHNHTFRSFGINLGHCGLSLVALPDVVFTHDSMLAKKKEQMFLLLSHLMNLTNPLTSVAPQLHEVSLID